MLLSEKQNLYAVNKWSTFSEVLQICGNLCLFLRKSAGTFIPIFSRNQHLPDVSTSSRDVELHSFTT